LVDVLKRHLPARFVLERWMIGHWTRQ
jgi:hypothetical protein